MAAILSQLQAIFGCLGGPLVLPPEMAEEEEARRERLREAKAARAKQEAESIAAVLPPPEAQEPMAPPPATGARVEAAPAPAPAPALEQIAAKETHEANDAAEKETHEEVHVEKESSEADEWGWDEEEEDDEEDDGGEALGQAPPFTVSDAAEESAPGLEPLTRLPTLDEIKARAAKSGTVHIKRAGNPFLDPLGLGAVVGAADASPQTMAAQLAPGDDDEEEEEEEDFFADMAPTVVSAKKLLVDPEQEKAATRSRLALQYTEEDEGDEGDAWGEFGDDGDKGGDAKEQAPQVSKLSGVSFTFEDSDEDLAGLDDLDFDDL